MTQPPKTTLEALADLREALCAFGRELLMNPPMPWIIVRIEAFVAWADSKLQRSPA